MPQGRDARTYPLSTVPGPKDLPSSVPWLSSFASPPYPHTATLCSAGLLGWRLPCSLWAMWGLPDTPTIALGQTSSPGPPEENLSCGDIFDGWSLGAGTPGASACRCLLVGSQQLPAFSSCPMSLRSLAGPSQGILRLGDPGRAPGCTPRSGLVTCGLSVFCPGDS